MVDFLLWYVFIAILGWLAFPLCAAIFKRAYDRGFTVSKVVGLLLWGYIYWMGNLSGLLSNNRAGAASAVLLLLAAAALLVKKLDLSESCTWLKDNRRMLLFQEAVFFSAFLIWAIVRGANPEIVGTEKPMELAFINGIYQSPSFPPNDPWLSGYAISYYYFGYLIVAALMHLLGTASGTAFNLAISMTFALVAVVSSGLLINLLAQKALELKQVIGQKKLRQILLISLLAPLFILIVSNGEGFLEMLHSRGLFWQAGADGSYTSGFWQWLDIQDLTQAPSLPFDWSPSRVGGTWWWRASRVLQDYTITGQSREIIDEFPFFSYLLADLHPHVLAMPYVLLALYAAFYVLRFSIADMGGGIHLLDYFKSPTLWFLALTTGSLLFLNTWDFPIYFGLICLALAVPVFKAEGWGKGSWVKFFAFAISFGVACIFLYFPFLVSLSSQAGGMLPSLVFHTRAVHFWVMFFPQIMVLLAYLISKLGKKFPWRKWLNAFLLGMVISLVLFLLSLMIPAIAQIGPQLLSGSGGNSEKIQLLLYANQSLLGVYDAQSNSQLITMAIQKFFDQPLMVLGLLLAITLIWTLLFNKPAEDELEEEPQSQETHSSDTFILLVILMGALLAIFPEFFYLRDQFGWRMNTIFKFYFQVWILWSLAAAYAVGGLTFLKMGWRKTLLTLGAILVIGVGLVYPAYGILNKTNSFKNIEWSLDGNQYYASSNALDVQAIQFLDTLPYGTVAEAIGGSYSSYGRVSKLSGYPAVLGWPGHELQWRGGGAEIGSRENDIKELYETDDWETARQILSTYDIRYVFIGSTERSLYQVHESKFVNHMKVEFSNQDAVIYSWMEVSLNGE
jgi:YYY domain-containing protein